MKLSLSAHANDHLELSWRDLFWLALGRTLQVSALVVKLNR